MTSFLYVLVGFIFGAALVYLAIRYIPTFIKSISGVTKLLKSYVVISIIIVLVSVTLNILNYIYDPFKDKTLTSEAINFYSGLIFAVIAGYYAFQQLQFSRFNKLIEDAGNQLKEKSYQRAERLYKEAYAINPSDFAVVGNLAELALISREEILYDELLARVIKIAIEDDEKIVPFYLKVARALLKQELGVAKAQLKEMLIFTEGNPQALLRFGWRFDEIRSSSVYSAISGESKMIFEKVFKYLNKSMTDEEKAAFVKEYC